MSYFTPIKKREDASHTDAATTIVPCSPPFLYNEGYCNGIRKEEGSPEKCCICLSSLCSVYNNDDPDTVVIRTKCKHLFHESCLRVVKERKPSGSECPLCRSLLTPIQSTATPSHPIQEETSIHQEITNQMRFAVIQAASRGRNAVRMALLRAQDTGVRNIASEIS